MPHWLVIDLEATTDEGGWPVTEMEIIEIGATLVDRKGRELDHFQRFVQPAAPAAADAVLPGTDAHHPGQYRCRPAPERGLAVIRAMARTNITRIWKAGSVGAITIASNCFRNGSACKSTAPLAACRT